jgi:hypothetical protein
MLERESGGVEQEEEATTTTGNGGTSQQAGRRPRAPSPVWDIELDLNSPSPTADNDPMVEQVTQSSALGKEDNQNKQSPPVYLIDIDSDDD